MSAARDPSDILQHTTASWQAGARGLNDASASCHRAGLQQGNSLRIAPACHVSVLREQTYKRSHTKSQKTVGHQTHACCNEITLSCQCPQMGLAYLGLCRLWLQREQQLRQRRDRRIVERQRGGQHVSAERRGQRVPQVDRAQRVQPGLHTTYQVGFLLCCSLPCRVPCC